jgi:pimeloyl-ACP methyl ester carboxylesterase
MKRAGLITGRPRACYYRTVPAVLAEQAAGLIPSARAVILQDAGHMAHIDQPGPWITAVRDFLA